MNYLPCSDPLAFLASGPRPLAYSPIAQSEARRLLNQFENADHQESESASSFMCTAFLAVFSSLLIITNFVNKNESCICSLNLFFLLLILIARSNSPVSATQWYVTKIIFRCTNMYIYIYILMILINSWSKWRLSSILIVLGRS